MSFEGYYQILCAKGHLTECDVYDTSIDENWTCPICKEKMAWYNIVDQTNGEGHLSVIELRVRMPDIYHVCPVCEAKTLVRHKTYFIPWDKGTHFLVEPQRDETQPSAGSLVVVKKGDVE